MKGFIEVTHEGTNSTVLISVANIKYVTAEDNSAVITFACIEHKNGKPWSAVCLCTTESYAEVVEKIRQAVN